MKMKSSQDIRWAADQRQVLTFQRYRGVTEPSRHKLGSRRGDFSLYPNAFNAACCPRCFPATEMPILLPMQGPEIPGKQDILPSAQSGRLTTPMKRQQPSHPSNSLSTSITKSSRICINLLPLLLYLGAIYLRLLPIRLGALEPLSPKTLVDLVLCRVAHPHCLVQKASGVTFIEGVHDFFAAYVAGSSGRSGEASRELRRTSVVFGVQMWMHGGGWDCGGSGVEVR